MSWAQASTFAVTGNGTAPIGQLPGTATNDSAAAGKVGEFQTATLTIASPVSLTTVVSSNVITLSLTAGDWDVSGVVLFAGSATPTGFIVSTATVSGTIQGYDSGATVEQGGITYGNINNYLAIVSPVARYSFASTTTVYLIAQAKFASGTCSAAGTIRARRVR